MLFVVVLIIILLIVLLLIFIFKKQNKTTDNIDQPIIHSKCNDHGLSVSDMICDHTKKRWRKKLGCSCATNVDCEGSLICLNWICSIDTGETNNFISNLPNPKKYTHKKVSWVDDTPI